MREINVAVIGSGSTYCPELVDGFLKAKDSLKLKKISFMDIDERKRNIVGDLCVRMLKNAECDCEVVFTDDLDVALGCDFSHQGISLVSVVTYIPSAHHKSAIGIFKKGIGDLYKRRLIEIGENCLILIRALD